MAFTGFDRPLLGTVYLIEQGADESVWRGDLENIHGHGMRLVVLWPPLSRWDAPDGVSASFDSVDTVMDICGGLGLGAILELEGQNPAFQFMPDCELKDDYLSRDDTGKHWVNYLHPEVAHMIDDYVREVAGHFRGHPALVGYDLFNEVNFRSTDRHTLRAFQLWLESKYGDTGRLNRVWGRFYSDFSQVRLDNLDHAYSDWSSLRPHLDFTEFRADTIASLLRRWAGVVREADPDHPVIADSSWSMTFFDNMFLANDDWKAAAEVDIFGLSVYPRSWEMSIADDPASLSQIYMGGACAAGGRPVMASELQTHNQTMVARGSSVGDELRLWTWQAFMYGLDSVVYWKWKPFSRGFQVTGRGMTLQDGTPNRRAAAAAEVARVLNGNPEVFPGRRVHDSGVALLYSPECDHLTDLTQTHEKGGLYRESFAGWYRFLFDRGVRPSIIRGWELGTDRYSHLRLLVCPALAMLGDEDTTRIRDFISGSGRVIADGRFSIIDEHCFARERAPGGLEREFGYRELDFLSPYEDSATSIADRFCAIELLGAESEARTAAGHPCCAKTGSTLYLPVFFGLDTERPQYVSLVDAFLRGSMDTSCRVLDPAPDVDVTISRGSDITMIGACNYAPAPRTIRVKLDTAGVCRSLTEDTPFETKDTGNGCLLEAVVPGREFAAFVFDNPDRETG